MSTAGVTGSYPAVGSEIARAEYHALLETLAAWINDRGQRLVELDERSGTAEAAQRTDVGLAFVLWQAISERRDELVGIDWRDHQRPNGEVATLVWRGIDDRTGAPLAADLAEAVALVDELIRRVAGALDHSDTSNVARHEARMSVETDLAVAERVIKVNFTAAMQVTAAVLPDLQPGGGIAFVASVAGYRGLPKALCYGPGKAALIHFAEVLHLDLAPKGIGVWVINPGFVATPLTAQNEFRMPALITPEQAAHEILSGWQRGQFEIHFPKRFTWWMKALRWLPQRIYFAVIRRFTGL